MKLLKFIIFITVLFTQAQENLIINYKVELNSLKNHPTNKLTKVFDNLNKINYTLKSTPKNQSFSFENVNSVLSSRKETGIVFKVFLSGRPE